MVVHSLRKSCAQRLIDAGVDIAIIYTWLGHPAVQKERRLAPISFRKLVAAAEMLESRQ